MATFILPQNPDNWSKLILGQGLKGKTIHDLGPGPSASNFGLDQYLLLRVVVRRRTQSNDLYEPCEKGKGPLPKEFLQKAKAILKAYGPFQKYLKSFDVSAEDQSTAWGPQYDSSFTLVRYYQYLSSKVTAETDWLQKVVMSPRRTRSQTARTTNPAPFTPTRGAELEDFRALHISTPMQEDEAQSEASNPFITSSTPEQLSPLNGLAAQHYKSIEDEQIVNTALILFLNALIIHNARIESEWTMTRAAFTMRDRSGEKLYEARVDGLLRLKGTGRVKMIVEVKPYLRYGPTGENHEVQMQEAAQIAAWIYQSPPQASQTTQTHKRILVSQDRHEVYLTIATFTDDYVRYLHQESNKPAFLTLDPCGPFFMDNKKHVKYLSYLLLGFTLMESGYKVN